MYSEERALEAWREFVATGEILDSQVRPEIARSWLRSKAAGVSPWSTASPAMNQTLLKEKRSRYERSLKAANPIMRFLVALLDCNVSLMDHESFVFELVSPYFDYPLTLGTFVLEEEVGTGNATVVAYEKKPVRINPYEQYRKVSQSYSGVSVPFLDSQGHYHGALNINSPFGLLPESALELCKLAVDVAGDLYRAGANRDAVMRDPGFFRPFLLLYEEPAFLMDGEGRIMVANSAMMKCCAGLGVGAEGNKRLYDYVEERDVADGLVDPGESFEFPQPIAFRSGAKGKRRIVNLIRRNYVSLSDGKGVFVCVFEDEAPSSDASGPARSRSTRGYATGGNCGAVDYIGESDSWKEVDRIVQKAAPLNASVLILGETGTGKEVVARALHRRSGRKGRFVAINCGALPRELLAAELFGYEGGAFTGAREAGSMGKFEYANGGTLFLDEIGEMPIDMQVSLLRVLQDKSVTRLGANEARPFDARIIAATNQEISQLIEDRKFRSDLYYRLSLVELKLPPLRHRAADIPLLIDYFNKEIAASLDLPVTPFPKRTVEALMEYSWPGNVRELRNVVERYLVMAGKGAEVTLDMLPSSIANSGTNGKGGSWGLAEEAATPSDARKEATDASSRASQGEKALLIEAVERCEGNMSLAAKSLGVSRNTLYRRLEKMHLKVRVVVEEE